MTIGSEGPTKPDANNHEVKLQSQMQTTTTSSNNPA